MIIGTSAYCGSGQDTLADGFCRFGYIKYSLGDFLRGIAKKKNIAPTRVNLQMIREQCDKRYGREYISKQMLNEIKRCNNENIVITGFRTKEEYIIFKNELDMKLIFVYANKDIRYSRMIKRAEIKDELLITELEKRMKKDEMVPLSRTKF